MGITKKQFNEMSDNAWIGIQLKFRINKEDFGFASFPDKKQLAKSLRGIIRSFIITLYSKKKITKKQVDKILNN